MEIDELQSIRPPAWVARLVGGPDMETRGPGRTHAGDLRVHTRAGDRFSLIQIVLPRARDLSAGTFQDRIQQVYELALETLEAQAASHAVRWWNFVPGIQRDAGDGLNWYMVFNAGRHAAMQQWFGAEYFDQQLATASAVGTHGDDFVLHVLGATQPGRPLENPRQIPAYNYSEHYGPLPPCFARGTGLTDATHPATLGTLLIGGTASIVGETTRHIGDLNAQIDETMRNLAHLVAAATGRAEADAAALARIREARVYVVRSADRAPIVAELTARLPGLERLEVVEAELCRAPLLVEIEGVTEAGVLARADALPARSRQTMA